MAKVILEDVRKVYHPDIVAVEDFNLTVEDGELVVLVGPSGCGKSTTLRLIAGLEDLTEGRITIGERLANDLAPKDRDIAMVFQSYALYPHMTVYQNMAFGLKLRKFPREEIDLRVREAGETLGIEALLDRRPAALSGGQRQRVAVGRAIVRRPEAFLFDEPLSNLDARLRVQMRAEISRLHTRLESTMVYVTHDQVEAMTLGDRLVVMLGGRIQQIGAPIDLYRGPANRFVAGFIGGPPMNFLEGELVRDDGLHFKTPALQIRLPERLDSPLRNHVGRKVELGIRPESVACVPPFAPDTCELSATVEVVEPLGNEAHLYLSIGNHSFVARVPPDRDYPLNQQISLAFDLSALHIFDADTGAALAGSS